MGILIGEIHSDASYGNSYDDRGRSTRVATRVFRVQATSPSEGPRSILATAGLPNPFQAHPEDTNLYAQSSSAKPQTSDSQYYWLVDVQYTSDIGSTTDGNPPSEDPTLNDWQVSYSFDRVSRVVDGTKVDSQTSPTGYTNSLRNSAGEAFDPPPEVDDSRPQFTFTKQMKNTDFNWSSLEALKDGVNSATVWTKLPRTLKVIDVTAGEEQTINKPSDDTEIKYRDVSITIQYNPDTWDLVILDRGNYATSQPASGNYKQREGASMWDFFDADGNPIEQLLDGAGGWLSPQTASPKWIVNQPYELVDWGFLNLPDPYNP